MISANLLKAMLFVLFHDSPKELGLVLTEAGRGFVKSSMIVTLLIPEMSILIDQRVFVAVQQHCPKPASS